MKERRINKLKQKQADFKSAEAHSVDISNKNDITSLNETLTKFYENRINEIRESYENQLKEIQKQVEYFKNLYEEEKAERKKVSNQYNSYLLGTAADNKKHWWQFGRKNAEQAPDSDN